MKQPTISVIVPVYNTEKYLDECVQSILNQIFTDFELLLIDDGSTDQSGAICDTYALQDKRVKVFHKENGGVSSARNMGLDEARGEWIVFVDSDDWVANSYFSELLSLKKDVDLVVSGVFLLNEGIQFAPPFKSLKIGDDLPFLDKQLCYTYFRTPWSKLFKNKIIQMQSLRFNTFLRIGEDTDFILRYLYAVNSIQLISKCSYHYRENWFCGLQRYSMSTIDVHTHLFYTIKSLTQLKSKFQYDFAIFELDLKIYFRRLFFVYLVEKAITYSDFVKELKLFRKYKGVYYDKSRFKEILVTFILKYFPFIAYIFLFKYRRTK